MSGELAKRRLVTVVCNERSGGGRAGRVLPKVVRRLQEGLADAELHGVISTSFEQARDLMQRKNHDYGEAWRNMRVSSLVDMILVKLLRIKQIEDNQGSTIVSEGIDAGFLDIVNYAVFALILLGEGEATLP